MVEYAIISTDSRTVEDTNFSIKIPNTQAGIVAKITQKPIRAIGVCLNFTQASIV